MAFKQVVFVRKPRIFKHISITSTKLLQFPKAINQFAKFAKIFVDEENKLMGIKLSERMGPGDFKVYATSASRFRININPIFEEYKLPNKYLRTEWTTDTKQGLIIFSYADLYDNSKPQKGNTHKNKAHPIVIKRKLKKDK